MTTHIVVVMDRSGSMGGLAMEAAGATNEFIKSLKEIKGRKSVTIHQFDDKFETTCSQVGQTKVPELIAGENYVPRGLTSLYDAIGKSINDLGNKKNVVMCVVTDGGENNSKEFNYETVKKMISEFEEELEPKRAELLSLREKLTVEIQSDIVEATKASAKELGIDVVLDKQVFITGGIDLTNLVVEKLNM
jgi:uncharacterized protein with von Willebrand factor type A (vWA) domain